MEDYLCKAQKAVFNTKYGELEFVFLDHEHALIRGSHIKFDGVDMCCSIQVYYESGDWHFNFDTVHVVHVIVGVAPSVVVSERIAVIILDEFVGIIQQRSDLLELARVNAQEKQEKYLLSEIEKHNKSIVLLKRQIQDLKVEKLVPDN